jgi:Zn-finger nucleic acid-binding protein
MRDESIVCVRCTSVLDESELAGLLVDVCPRCGGLWLDEGELAKLAGVPESKLGPLREALAGSDGGPPPIPSDTQKKCPACPGQLQEVKLGPVTVDACGQCRGLFLDRGELDQAVDMVKTQDADHATVLAALHVAALG